MALEESNGEADPGPALPRQDPEEGGGLAGFFKHCLGMLRPHLRLSLLLLLTLLPILVFDVAQPLFYRAIIDQAILPRNLGRLGFLITLLGSLVVLRLLAELGKEYVTLRLGGAVANDLRLRMFNHLQQLPLGFHARAQSGDLMYRYTADLSNVENALTRELPSGLLRTLTLIGCASLLFTVDWRLALGALVLVSALVYGSRYLTPLADQAGEAIQEDASELATMVQETLGAQQVIKAYGLRPLLLSRFTRSLEQMGRKYSRYGLVSGYVSATVGVGGTSISILATGIGAFLVINGTLSIGSLFAFADLLWNVANAMQETSGSLRPLQQAASAERRIRSLLEEPLTVTDVPDASSLPAFQEAIRLEDVTFSYTGEQPNLRNASLALRHGERVAFVGPSGSGKSTVLSLILRFHDPQEGRVTVDGCDLRRVKQDSWREQLAVVFQENVLFNTTFRENIRLGRPSATDGEIEAAAQQAEIHDFILTLPHGYETPVGERGGRLSGGQRQRIAIARALLRDPAVLILDEATSALDPATEQAVNATLERIGQGRTVISVTHRLAGAVRSDRIFVLKQGSVAESGTHTELVARGGLYASLWEKQSGMELSQDGSRAHVQSSRLRSIPILRDLSEAHLREVAGEFVTENVPEERTVIHQGDSGDRFYLVVRGSVEILRRDESGTQRRLAVLQDGDHFGEIALVRNVPRTATVRTLTPCVFLTLQRGQLLDLLERSPETDATLRELVEGRYQEAHARG